MKTHEGIDAVERFEINKWLESQPTVKRTLKQFYQEGYIVGKSLEDSLRYVNTEKRANLLAEVVEEYVLTKKLSDDHLDRSRSEKQISRILRAFEI